MIPRPLQNYLLLLLTLTSTLHSQIEDGGFFGFVYFPQQQVPTTFNAGYSQYSAVWELTDSHPQGAFQAGLPHNWMEVLKPAGYPEAPADNEAKYYSTIEGGLGYWEDIRFDTLAPKFKMGGVARDFTTVADGPGWGWGTWDNNLSGKMGIAQLSNQLIFPPDGLPLAQNSHGDFFGYGYGYMNLPLIDPSNTSFGSNTPTGGNCWTLFINSTNFKGPAAFFLPDFFSAPAISDPTLSGLFLDTLDANPFRGDAMEILHIPSAVATTTNGTQYAKIANIQFPANEGNRTVLLQNVRSYTKGALWNAVNSWFNGGPIPTGTFHEPSSHHHLTNFGPTPILDSDVTLGPKTTHEYERPILHLHKLARGIDNHPHTFRYEWTSPLVRKVGNHFVLPNYYRLDTINDTPEWTPIPKSQVPPSTGLLAVQFPPEQNHSQQPRTTPHTTNPDWTAPGPAAGPFTTTFADNSRATYYWYRFIDQPAIVNAKYSEANRQQLQQRIELIHRHWPINRNYIPPPTSGTLASIDPGSIVTPPPGLEVGYVPIVTRQELIDPNNDYQNWANTHSASRLSDPIADFDNDGLSNQFERLFALDPLSANSASSSIIKPTTSPHQFTYRRRQTSLTKKTYSIWLSSTLEPNSWFRDDSTTQKITGTNNDGTENILISINPALLNNQKVFLRIKVQ